MKNNTIFNNIIFNTSYLCCVPRPYTLLNNIITDYNNLPEYQQLLYVDKVLESNHQFRVLSNLLKSSSNVEKRRLINKRYYQANKLKMNEINSLYQKNNIEQTQCIKKKSNARRYHCGCCNQIMSICTYYGHMNSIKHMANFSNFQNRNPDATLVWTALY